MDSHLVLYRKNTIASYVANERLIVTLVLESPALSEIYMEEQYIEIWGRLALRFTYLVYTLQSSTSDPKCQSMVIEIYSISELYKNNESY